jgi:hypothetical protein
MWTPETRDFFLDEGDIPAEYRTDIDHIQVRKTSGGYTVFSRSREYDQKVDLYTPWSEWAEVKSDDSFAVVMWTFSQQVLEKSAVDEYRWGSEAREVI